MIELLSKDENYDACIKLLPNFLLKSEQKVDMMNASHLCDLAEENFIRTFPEFNFQPEVAQNYGLLLSFHLIEFLSDSLNDGVNLLKFIRG